MKPLERIVVLGGAGNMGRVAVRTAASLDGIREVIIGDRDLAAAEKIAAEKASSAKVRIHAERIDVSDSMALRRLLSEAGVVLNTTGPFHKFGVPILRAAIEARTHYLDICDDWEPTLEMMREHQNAANAGIVAIIGMGASPGVSNLLAKVAARELDEVTDLYTAWPLDVPIGGVSISEDKESLVDQNGKPSAAVRHLMQQISGLIRVVEGGRLVDRPPLDAVEIDYPGRGRGAAYTVGHPEPLTMCETLGIRGRSACLMILTTQALSLLKDLNAALDQKTLTNEQAAAIMIAPGALRTLKAVVKSLGLKGHGDLPPFFAFADRNQGREGGARRRIGQHCSERNGEVDGRAAGARVTAIAGRTPRHTWSVRARGGNRAGQLLRSVGAVLRSADGALKRDPQRDDRSWARHGCQTFKHQPKYLRLRITRASFEKRALVGVLYPLRSVSDDGESTVAAGNRHDKSPDQ